MEREKDDTHHIWKSQQICEMSRSSQASLSFDIIGGVIDLMCDVPQALQNTRNDKVMFWTVDHWALALKLGKQQRISANPLEGLKESKIQQGSECEEFSRNAP